MQTKQAGLGAALAVLVMFFGLMTLVGVILLMMWFQPDIEHSPAEVVKQSEIRANEVQLIPGMPILRHPYQPDSGVLS